MSSDQVVRLTHCDGTTGHPAMLIEVMDYIGFRWFPEFVVYEVYRDFNQQYYRAEVFIYPNDRSTINPPPLHHALGFGVTVEMAVHEAAYICLTFLRAEYRLLDHSPFRYIPSGYLGEAGHHHTVHLDARDEPYEVHQLIQLAQDQDRSLHALRYELFATRELLWDALGHLSTAVDAGLLPTDVLYPARTEFPPHLALPKVGGHTPEQGPLRSLDGWPHPRPCPYGRQGPEACTFSASSRELPGYRTRPRVPGMLVP